MTKGLKNGLVSIVIPVVRNDKHIAECVEHIKKSTYTNYEIIIVDEGLERSAQRNIGIKRAQGEFLLWLDSDMMISPGLIEECVGIYSRRGQVNGIYIPEKIVTPGWFGSLRNWERQFYTGTLVDVMRFVRLRDCPLFDESLHGVEDSDWERQFKPGPRYISTAHFNHHDKVDLWKYLKKKAYYAQCLVQYKRKNPADKLLTLKYRCFDVFVQDGKWKRLIKSPHMTIGVMLLLLARGVIMKWQMWRYK